MRVSRAWLQTYFVQELPTGQELADAFTFHAFEVEEQEDDLIDLKVLPDRAGYALSHRGIALELGAALSVPLKHDPLREALPEWPKSQALTVSVEDERTCLRYIGAVVRGVKIGPSPQWLTEALESVGQRSINNVVDATNYVMLNLGQPLHAFDAAKLQSKDGTYAISVRAAKAGEKITTLSSEAYELSPERLIITDAHADLPIGIAGVKGGKAAEVDAQTTDLIIESANFDGTSVRRTAQKLKLFTDASSRFQNRPSPELAAYGMRDVLALIKDIAGGQLEGVIDHYPNPVVLAPVSVTLGNINGLLGSSFSYEEVLGAFTRLTLPVKTNNDTFTVLPPFERTDLSIPEDLVEEVGRTLGYDKLPPRALPPITTKPDQARFRGIERMKDELVAQGFTEVSTQSFTKKGDIVLANPLDTKKPALRTSLKENLDEALAHARNYAPLVLPPNEKPRLFEVGSVFPKDGEYVELRMTEVPAAWGKDFPTFDNLSKAKLEEYGKDYEPARYNLSPFKPFSQYPFIVRDVAMWLPLGNRTEDYKEIINTIFSSAGDFLIEVSLLDMYEKGDRKSVAYRLIFQSFDRTLTDEEANAAMEKVYSALKAKGFDIR